jgi:hypothetical protein
VNALRQGMALSVIVLSLAVLYQYKNNIITYMLFFLAVLLHKSAVVVLFAYIAAKFIPKLKNTLILFYIFLFLSPFAGYVLLFIAQVLNIEILVYKFTSLSKGTTGSTSIYIKLGVLLILLNYFHYVARFNKDKLYVFLLKYYTLFAAIAVLCIDFPSMFNRLLMFFGIIEPLLFALAIYGYRQKSLLLMLTLFLATLYLIFIFNYPSMVMELRLQN